MTDDAVLHRDDLIPTTRALLSAHGRYVAFHVRGPGVGGRRIHAIAEALKRPAESSGALLVVNDRVDVAASVGLSAVHLGQRSLPPGVARGLLGQSALIGVSVHDRAEIDAVRGEADYLIAGTTFASATHPGQEPRGAAWVTAMAEEAEVPIVAIGGITPARAREVGRGVYGVAVLSGIWDPADPVAAAAEYLNALST